MYLLYDRKESKEDVAIAGEINKRKRKKKLRYRESNPGLRGTYLSGYESAKC
jgi:hypothetical protein